MNLRFETDEEFLNTKKELVRRLQGRAIRKIEKPDFRPSAVMILLMNKNGEAYVLLTKRTDKVATHKGEISFPGGGYDAADGTLRNTAYRETFEEVGIAPGDIEYLGEFDEFLSIWGFHVATFVGAIPHPYPYLISRDEIEDFVEAPLSMFYNRELTRIEKVPYEGRDYNVYYYHYNGFQIWGLTARILTEFAEKLLHG